MRRLVAAGGAAILAVGHSAEVQAGEAAWTAVSVS